MSEATDKSEASSGWKRILGIFIRIVLICLLLIILLGFSVRNIWPWEFGLHLIAGPFFHGWKNLPPFFSHWRSALLPLACVAIAIALAHRFILWWIKSKDTRMTWRLKHTASAASLLLLGSAAAIAVSGITHQAAWLASSPWVENKGAKTYQTVAIMNARMVILALLEYVAEHERYPETLEEAVTVSELPIRSLMVETGSGKPKQPFIFLRPGRAFTGRLEPVLVSPVIGTDRVVVGYSNNSVRTMTLKEWQTMKQEIQAAHE